MGAKVLSSTEASLCCGEAGEKEKESAHLWEPLRRRVELRPFIKQANT